MFNHLFFPLVWVIPCWCLPILATDNTECCPCLLPRGKHRTGAPHMSDVTSQSEASTGRCWPIRSQHLRAGGTANQAQSMNPEIFVCAQLKGIFSIWSICFIRIRNLFTQGHSMWIFVKKMAKRCGGWQIKPMTSPDQDPLSTKSNSSGFGSYSQMKF